MINTQFIIRIIIIALVFWLLSAIWPFILFAVILFAGWKIYNSKNNMIFSKFPFTRKAASTFNPDFTKSEYDNWLDYISMGGTAKQWERLKKANKWNFPKDNTEIFMEYQEKLRPLSNEYYSLIEQIEKDWSTIYKLKDYTGALSQKIEKECTDAISYFSKMHAIDMKYGESSPKNIPPFKRLAMLYERQGKYESSIETCKNAISFGMDESSRMLRMIKKSGRVPTSEEESLINKIQKNK